MVAISYPQTCKPIAIKPRSVGPRSVDPRSVGPSNVEPSYARRRAAAAALVVGLLVALLLAAQALTSGGASTTLSTETSVPAAGVVVRHLDAYGAGGAALPAGAVYVVQPGDTLWSIARAIEPTGDVAAVADRLADLNGSSAIDVGQRLRLH